MANEVAQLPRRSEVPDVPANALPCAIEQLAIGLQQAIGSMMATDISLEIHNVRNQNGSSTRISLRAYRKDREVVNREYNDE